MWTPRRQALHKREEMEGRDMPTKKGWEFTHICTYVYHIYVHMYMYMKKAQKSERPRKANCSPKMKAFRV